MSNAAERLKEMVIPTAFSHSLVPHDHKSIFTGVLEAETRSQ